MRDSKGGREYIPGDKEQGITRVILNIHFYFQHFTKKNIQPGEIYTTKPFKAFHFCKLSQPLINFL